MYSSVGSLESNIRSHCHTLLLHVAIFSSASNTGSSNHTFSMNVQSCFAKPGLQGSKSLNICMRGRMFRCFCQLPSGISKTHSTRQSAVALGRYRVSFIQKERSILERGITNGVISCLSLLIYHVLCKLDTFAMQRYPLRNAGDKSEHWYTLQQRRYS